MLSLLDGVRIEYSSPEGSTAIFDVKRPIMIGSSELLIDLTELVDRSITIPLHGINRLEYNKSFAKPLPRHFLMVRQTLINKINEENIFFPYAPFDAIIATGVALTKIVVGGSTAEWVDTINRILIDRQLSLLNDNLIAYALYRWAQENPKVTLTKSVNDWMSFLKEYVDGNIDLYPTTARKVGDLMTKSIPLLEPLGFHFISHDKTGGTYQREVSSPESLKLEQLTVENAEEIANRFFRLSTLTPEPILPTTLYDPTNPYSSPRR